MARDLISFKPGWDGALDMADVPTISPPTIMVEIPLSKAPLASKSTKNSVCTRLLYF